MFVKTFGWENICQKLIQKILLFMFMFIINKLFIMSAGDGAVFSVG